MATALPLPNLDDRRWVDLVDEARALIPFYAPSWTDHNVHDPGITLVELFAWIAEMDLYGVNRITDAHRRKFLALAGITPAPTHPATAIVELVLEPGALPRTLPAGLELTGQDVFGTSVRFRARHDMTASPGRLAAVLSAQSTPSGERDLTTAWLRGEPVQPFGPDPRPGAVLCLGFAVADPAGRSGAGERDRLAAQVDGREPAYQPRSEHHSAVLRWELATGPDRWAALDPDDVDDDTRAFTLDGRVVVRVPGPVPAVRLGARGRTLTWLRVRLARGSFDAAPVLRGLAFNAVEVEQAVPAVVALRLAAGVRVHGTPPAPGGLTAVDLSLDRAGEVIDVGFAPAAADRPAVRLLAFDPPTRSLTIEAAWVARSTGGPAPHVEVPDGPLVESSVSVATLESGTWRRWSPRRDFDASARSDAHVVVEPTSATVQFGNGEHGRTPPPGATLLVTADLTRGAGGNLAARTIDTVARSPHNRAAVPDLDALAAQLIGIANVVPAAGGAAAETAAAAVARARVAREQATRAVTLADYVDLARETPGVRLSRAEAIANRHPGFACLSAPGVVTVLVLPYLPADRPMPSLGLRRAVAAYLNRRRVIGTRIEVAGPVYVRATVRATVAAAAGARTDDLIGAIGEALDRFLHPLTGGPLGTGWPFGRDVYRSEVLAVIDEVPGVEHVLALELVSGDGTVSCANLCVGPTGLVDAGAHEIEVHS